MDRATAVSCPAEAVAAGLAAEVAAQLEWGEHGGDCGGAAATKPLPAEMQRLVPEPERKPVPEPVPKPVPVAPVPAASKTCSNPTGALPPSPAEPQTPAPKPGAAPLEPAPLLLCAVVRTLRDDMGFEQEQIDKCTAKLSEDGKDVTVSKVERHQVAAKGEPVGLMCEDVAG